MDPDLFASLYRELHTLAESQLRRNGAGISLGATTLLHEAWLNLSQRNSAVFPDRAHFLAYAGKAMRGLIIDYARARRARKRGGEFEITSIGDSDPAAPDRSSEEIDRLGDALEQLTGLDAELAQLVDLHFFCGLSFVELAAMRGVSERTVQRDWRKARMLLQRLV